MPFGPPLLLASNIFLYLSLSFLAIVAARGCDKTFILATANLFLAGLLYLGESFRPRTRAYSSHTYPIILIWSLVYCLIYECFIYFGDFIAPCSVMIAEALAPFLLIFYTKSDPGDSLRKFMVQLSPAVLLIVIFILDFMHLQQFSWKVLLPLVLVVPFAASQMCARSLARISTDAIWIQMRMALFRGAMLLSLALVQANREMGRNLHVDVFPTAVLAGGILLTQACYLGGLRRCSPLFSALFLSTSVPIAIFADRLAFIKTVHHPASFWVAILFCTAIGVEFLWTSHLGKDDDLSREAGV